MERIRWRWCYYVDRVLFELFGKRSIFALISLASSSPSLFLLIFLDVHLPKLPLAVGLEAIG